MIVFGGFNAATRKSESFTVDWSLENTLDNVYATFDSIIYLNKAMSKLYYLDLKATKKFLEFKHNELGFDRFESIKLCSNMDCFWLVKCEFEPILIRLIQFTTENILRQIVLANQQVDIDDCEIFTTDLMVYLMKKSTNEIIFQCENQQATNMTTSANVSQELPHKLDINEKIVNVCCSKEHVLFLGEKSGSVYSVGIGTR
jgi:hypothetical protein